MVESLRTLPHEQALGLLSKLRNESGSPSLPSSSHLIEHRHIRGLLPPSQNTLDFELTLRHPVAYPALFPVSYADLPQEEMLKSMTTPWLRQGQTVVPSPCPDVPPLSTQAYMTPDQEDDDNDDQFEIKMGSPDPAHADLLGPFFDERLRLLDISQWTPVAIPNDLAITAISHYLENDYATMPLFNADLFLQDLVSLQNSFCSSFLVTAILCWACQALTPLQPDAAAYSVAFFAQAQQHFSDQPQLNSLTTISALQILSMCAATYGKDDMSLQFLQESVSLGRLMGLFDVTSQSESAGMWLGNHEDWARTASYTAWGVYNWVSVYSLHYHIFEIETPPLLPKPGDSSASRPGIDSTTTTTTTTTTAMTIALHAQVMSASSDMWIIFSDVLRRFYGPQDDDLLQQPPSLRFAEETYHRLLRWASALPLQLARAEENGHNVVMMHIYFHAVVTDLFRPFLDSPLRSERLPSFSTDLATPEAVYTASVTQLKRLLLLYRLRHKSASLSMLWKTAVVYVANATIREAGTATAAAVMTQVEPPNDDDDDNNTNNNNKNNSNSNKYDNNDNEPTADERRFYLDLCLSALEDLYVSFPVFGSVAQGIVGMAMRHEAIPAEKAAGVLRRLAEIARRRAAGQGMTDKAEARWIVDFDLAMTDPEAAQGRYMAEQLEGLMLSESGAEDQG